VLRERDRLATALAGAAENIATAPRPWWRRWPGSAR
jgi:hypothetical protein